MLRGWGGGPFKAEREEQDGGAVGAGCGRSQAEKCKALASFTAGFTCPFRGHLASDAATSLKGRAREVISVP